MPDPERAPLGRRAFEKSRGRALHKEQVLKHTRAARLTHRADIKSDRHAARNQLYPGSRTSWNTVGNLR